VSEPILAQRYRLVEALPPGRAHAVHRALDTADRPVVITVLRPADADAFMRHMGTVAAARHLDLAAVVDVGRAGADTYVVTDDVQGADAAARGRAPGPPAFQATRRPQAPATPSLRPLPAGRRVPQAADLGAVLVGQGRDGHRPALRGQRPDAETEQEHRDREVGRVLVVGPRTQKGRATAGPPALSSVRLGEAA